MDLPSRKERRQSIKKTIKEQERKVIQSTKAFKKTKAPKRSFFKYLILLVFLVTNAFLIYTYNIFLLLFFVPGFFMVMFFLFQKNKKLLWINLVSTLLLTIGILEVLYRQNFQ